MEPADCPHAKVDAVLQKVTSNNVKMHGRTTSFYVDFPRHIIIISVMKPIYISATIQDSGKTSVSLGLMQVLMHRKLDPGYCKPVGQHYVSYQGEDVDEDTALMHEVFKMTDNPYCMSPIAIKRGFTRNFIMNPSVAPLEKEILTSVENLSSNHQMMIIEGTGHAGVGSCFGLSNARVAELLGADVVIVTAGGIGKPIDEIALSMALFQDHNVNVLGVILNKVLPAKLEKITETVSKGLEHLGTKLLGCVPYETSLESFTVGQVAEEFKLQVLCGNDHLSNRIDNTVIAAMEPQNVMEYICDDTLVITPADRIDNILVSLTMLSKHGPHNGGLILTGRIDPHPKLLPFLESSNIPVLMSKEDTFTFSSKMANLLFKIRSYDTEKITTLRLLVENHVDVDSLVRTMQK